MNTSLLHVTSKSSLTWRTRGVKPYATMSIRAEVHLESSGVAGAETFSRQLPPRASSYDYNTCSYR